ncbi:hypothetical protein D3879_24910 [Pseudomonas cavernicola]|uniref:Integrase n=1 Tax=Pseudomonas cavernicola TaxID=2320866 RepID=A0A418X993_9PSED|nr:hypothetical protein [Pseudomonas cavernicola]RJG09054.1 hypothetical protein D3879_24910 [Pseudomonas cavernicola]
MNHHFKNYVEFNKKCASEQGISWPVKTNYNGCIDRDKAWALDELCGSNGRPTYWLSDLGMDEKCLALVNERRRVTGQSVLIKKALSPAWQDFIKAAIIDQIFIRKNKAGHVAMSIIRPIRVIATCALEVEPWDLTQEHIALAQAVALESQSSGQLARLVTAVVRNIIDLNFLTDRAPLLSKLLNSPLSRSARKPLPGDMRQKLAQRKAAEKLPERRAFWELVRIVFTEKPLTFYDELRFAQLKILVLCGLRIGEVPYIPVDWMRTYHYLDKKGRPAGEAGGFSDSIALRYFVEKRELSDEEGSLLYPDIQHIPRMFEESVREILGHISTLTAPLRARLKQQMEQGRLLTDYRLDKLVPVYELFPYLTGNPFIYVDSEQSVLTERYRRTYDIEVLEEIKRRQSARAQHNGKIRPQVHRYFYNLNLGNNSILKFRDATGQPCKPDYSNGYFLVSEVESYIRQHLPAKLSDLTMLRTTTGKIATHEMLFLAPKRSLLEGRNGGICDLTRYIGIGTVTAGDLQMNLYDRHIDGATIFQRYGQTDEDRKLTINSHTFRHLQNSELFRLGVADTIITKRFGRRSVTQSYVYDHRSLAEELQAIELPEAAQAVLGENSSMVLAMINSGKISGSLVDEFKKIQRKLGDQAAFEFLAAEADGFHTTPYGFCMNSFMVNPCPKHLECYSGCRHLSSSTLPNHRDNLARLQDQFMIAVRQIESRPSNSIGRDNQLQHAKSRLTNIQQILSSEPGSKPFADGEDLSTPLEEPPDIFYE